MSAEATRGNTKHDADAGGADELSELRRRAYGPRPDIDDDPAALARLDELEDRVRARLAEGAALRAASERAASNRAPSEHAASGIAQPERAQSDIERPGRPAVALEIPPSTAGAASTPLPSQAESRPRAPGWHAALLGATAVAALVLGAIAWSGIPPAVTPVTPAAASPIPADPIHVVNEQHWSTSSAEGYNEFLDHLRIELLATPGLERLSERIIFEKLRPFGGLYGRKVWAGPTNDGEYCMIIGDRPAPHTGCISAADDAYAAPFTLILPAGNAASAFDRSAPAEGAVEPGVPVSYTLQPGGNVTAEPAVGQTVPQD